MIYKVKYSHYVPVNVRTLYVFCTLNYMYFFTFYIIYLMIIRYLTGI